MVTDGQVRKLRRLLLRGESLAATARKTGMDEKTGRKYRDSPEPPSMRKSRRTWRTRVDPFADVWPEVQQRLEAEPRLRAFTLFDGLQDRYSGRFSESQRRTFERRVRDWRARHGRGREVMFPQVPDPGGLGASDFTSMNLLRVTIAKQPFDHLVYHFTLSARRTRTAMPNRRTAISRRPWTRPCCCEAAAISPAARSTNGSSGSWPTNATRRAGPSSPRRKRALASCRRASWITGNASPASRSVKALAKWERSG